ncbi:MAG TPA: Hsp20/alpha crystallin family protein [Roseiflexaceae bacterium]|nr:Hsp20/alpha crystallin family protein [Roseiflexaceae bacterium]
MTTALTRFEPFADALRLSDAMEQLLNESWVLPRAFFGGWSGTVSMPLDLYETDEAYVVTAFMPGVPSDKLDIQVQQNILSIRGEVSVEQPKDGRYLMQERGSGVFARSIRLPTPVDADSIVATLKDGVLTITLPKSESVKPRRIAVKAA